MSWTQNCAFDSPIHAFAPPCEHPPADLRFGPFNRLLCREFLIGRMGEGIKTD